MKSFVLLLFLLGCFPVYSQTSINNYKYVVVPERFGFFKQNDEYGLNTMTKSLLEETGFKTWFDNATLPTDLANNKCNTLNAEVTERKSMFATRLTLLLKDCKGNILFKSKEGNSREKDYALAYTQALQDAFTSLKEAKYVYQPATATQDQPRAATPDSATAVKITATIASPAAGTLYAQPTANGYQLIDTTPKTVLRMFKSSVPGCYIADNGTSNGIVFKRDDSWVFEYYKDGKLMTEKLLIKF